MAGGNLISQTRPACLDTGESPSNNRPGRRDLLRRIGGCQLIQVTACFRPIDDQGVSASEAIRPKQLVKGRGTCLPRNRLPLGPSFFATAMACSYDCALGRVPAHGSDCGALCRTASFRVGGLLFGLCRRRWRGRCWRGGWWRCSWRLRLRWRCGRRRHHRRERHYDG